MKFHRLPNGKLDKWWIWGKIKFFLNLTIAEMGQIKVIIEFTTLAAVLLIYLRIPPSKLFLLAITFFLFVSFLVFGMWLDKKRVPHISNEIGHAADPQFTEILTNTREILKKVKEIK